MVTVPTYDRGGGRHSIPPYSTAVCTVPAKKEKTAQVTMDMGYGICERFRITWSRCGRRAMKQHIVCGCMWSCEKLKVLSFLTGLGLMMFDLLHSN